MSDKTTFVSFLLDETGSMEPIAEDTVDGFNEYLDTLKKTGEDIVFSFVSFNSSETRRRYVAEPIASVKPLKRRDYKPRHTTPLIDAAVKIIKATEEAVEHRGDDPNVVVVMQTDGLENVSVEYTNADLAALMKEKDAAGWQFVFLGAGVDAFAAARAAGMHIPAERIVSYSRGLSRAAFKETAMNVGEFSKSGDAEMLRYSPRQRKALGDEHASKYVDDSGSAADGGSAADASGEPAGDASAGKRDPGTGADTSSKPKKRRFWQRRERSTADDYDLNR